VGVHSKASIAKNWPERGTPLSTALAQFDEAADYRAERLRREQREWGMMLIAYGDDSYDKKEARVFAAAAVVARQGDWDAFLPKWKTRNPIPFHATDCDSDQGDYQGRDHWENKTLYASNVRQFVDSPLIGAGVAISIPDYWEVFPFAPPDKWWPYYLCFAGVLSSICSIARLSIPPETIKVTFDNDPRKEFNSGQIFDFIGNQPGSLAPCLEDGIEFRNHRTTPALQVADLLARETMKDLDNRIGQNVRWPRQSLIELLRSKRFATVLYDRPKLEEHRAIADSLHADPEKGRAFTKWLASNGIKDSIHTRFRFIAEG